MQARVLEPENQCITPNFDYLASLGVRFQRAYTTNAVCSPARASLMTGLLPHNHGVIWVTHTADDDQSCLRKDKPHWAQMLVQAGYTTGYFSKWHVERSATIEDFGWIVNGSSDLNQKKKKGLTADSESKPEYYVAKYLEHPEGYAKVLRNPETEDINYQKGFAEYFGGRILLTQRVVWDGPWKFVFNGFDYDELYNLEKDPYEMNNLASKDEYVEVVRKMAGQMWRVIKETGDRSLLKSDYPILRLAPFGPGD